MLVSEKFIPLLRNRHPYVLARTILVRVLLSFVNTSLVVLAVLEGVTYCYGVNSQTPLEILKMNHLSDSCPEETYFPHSSCYVQTPLATHSTHLPSEIRSPGRNLLFPLHLFPSRMIVFFFTTTMHL